METLRIERSYLGNIILVDSLIISLVLLLPGISHLFPIPVYYIDPMRLGVFTSYILLRDKLNSLIIAVSIPMISMIISGHPTFYKSILISGELLLNIGMIMYLISKGYKYLYLKILLSILLSKISYYVFKYIFINFDLVNGTLISTPLLLQLLISLLLSLLLYLSFIGHDKLSNREEK